MMKKTILMLAATAFIAVSCGEGETSAPEKEEKAPAQTEETSGDKVAEEAMLTIEGNDQMKYDKDRLEVTEGQKVILTLKHVGSMPKETMGHNWVLLKKGTNVDEFAQAAIQAKENNYISPDHADEIIAMTPMIGGGEQAQVEFDAPEPGIYDFICSFPGHYGMMKGKFVVRKK